MNEPTENRADQGEEMIEQCCAKLAEFYPNVQIFVNRVEEGGELFTQFTYGVGDWHSRQNQVREWIIIGEEIARCRARKNWRMRDEGDEEDDEHE